MDIIICHGTMGSPDINWFPWLKTELESMGHAVYVPTFPTPQNQTKDNWCAALRDETPTFGRDTILIGHSISATFLLHILETIKTPVCQSVFVSPVMDDIGIEEYDRLNNTFVHHDFDWDAINNNKGRAVIFHGDNDPYVPLSHPETLSQKIMTPISIIKNGGHLNSESGHDQLPGLLHILNF